MEEYEPKTCVASEGKVGGGFAVGQSSCWVGRLKESVNEGDQGHSERAKHRVQPINLKKDLIVIHRGGGSRNG